MANTPPSGTRPRTASTPRRPCSSFSCAERAPPRFDTRGGLRCPDSRHTCQLRFAVEPRRQMLAPDPA
jgi:hypothetical protein